MIRERPSKEPIEKLKGQFDHSLILNPTENIPVKTAGNIKFLEGLYVPEEDRDEKSRVIFAGRNEISAYMRELYTCWMDNLRAADASFKLYSGLHAHIILFMSITSIGDRVLILPELGGGHYATQAILERLGLSIKSLPIDTHHLKIDVQKARQLIEEWDPKVVFVDRSDGLCYEDFSWLADYQNTYRVFDASQYLSHIIAADYKNPFDMGADLILTTLHKNYPGPQKAAFFTRQRDEYWKLLQHGLSSYVSNSHPLQIFNAVLSPMSNIEIKEYSQRMLSNASRMYETLLSVGVPVVERPTHGPITQQIWIAPKDTSISFRLFKNMEAMGFNASHRELPYHLGMGIRIGTAGATRQGLQPEQAFQVASLIGRAFHEPTLKESLVQEATDIIFSIRKASPLL